MTKTQEEMMKKDLTELGSVMRTFANKNDGMEQAMRAMEHRQESTEKTIKNLDQKYESMMNMMAQMMAKLSDKEKGEEGSSSGGYQRLDLVSKKPERIEGRGGNRLPKLDFPVFDGENPREWVRRANKYFQIQGVEEELKSDLAQLHLKGKADIWFLGMYHGRAEVPWEELSRAICERFGGGTPEETIEEFNKLAQTGSVTDYLEKFELLKSLNLEVIRKAQRTIPHGAPYHSSSLGSSRPNPVPQLRNKWHHEGSRILRDNYHRGPKAGGNTADNFRKISPTEFNYRREKGLCYKCAEPYTLGHICKQAQIQYILEDEPTELIEVAEGEMDEGEEFCDCIEGGISNERIEVSIHTLSGGEGHSTFKLKGVLAGKELLILVDSGSTHCFLDEMVASHLQLQVTGTPLVVRVANGERLESRQLSRPLSWKIQGHEFQHHFNTLQLGSCDMVLGVDWLARYSPIEFDFNQLSMKFTRGKEKVELKGESNKLKLTAIKGSKLMKWRRKQEYGVTALLTILEEGQDEVPAEVKQMLNQYQDIFVEPQGLPPPRSHDHGIPLKEGARPFQLRPYRCPYVQKSEIEKLVREMLQMGIIQPSNNSFASPVLLVKKKDGSWRFCVDYRQLNELTVKDKFPMPLIDELIDELHGSRYFTKIDLRAGYHQIRVKMEDRHKTAFRTHQGLYEFKVMPFGLTNAPATFQSLMNQVFKEQLRKFVIVFFDDILVYSPTLETHLQHVTEVLDLLRQHQLFAKQSKCCFAQTQMEYLGHIITAEGVQADPRKIEGMINWPRPGNMKQLKGFLGLTGYYRKFVRGYGSIAKPLTTLLKKEGFQWNEEAEEAFQRLKMAMCSTPVLVLPDFS
ncbi:uncharacterized protein [Coffea arabica]|uniref:Reverse transcriptase domain-containing protein n=1 Tax=Coffea arabica TaxID=13443 RepID=A0ABM4UQG8_COFAR